MKFFRIFCVSRAFQVLYTSRTSRVLLATFFIFFLFSHRSFDLTAEARALRVISLYPGHTDNIAALGGASLLVARAHNDDLESLGPLPRLPATVTPEAILAHRPDILIMRTLNAAANPNLAPVLERAGVRVHVVDPPTWAAFERYLRDLAHITDLDPQQALIRFADAQAFARTFSQDRKANGARPPRVFLEATGKELHTCSPDSWAAQVIRLCGGENAAESALPLRPGSALAPWGVERAVALAGKLDIYLVQQGAMNASTRADVLSRPWFRAFERAGSVQLAFIPERYLSRPSLIGLECGIDLLCSTFYPKEAK